MVIKTTAYSVELKTIEAKAHNPSMIKSQTNSAAGSNVLDNPSEFVNYRITWLNRVQHTYDNILLILLP